MASWGGGGLEALIDEVRLWSDAGASHLSINTMGAGFTSVDEHLKALGSAAEALRLVPS